jgi:tRNA A37 methylthiotransferase MiaB
MADQVPENVKGERIERLIEVVQELAARRNAERVGGVEEVLVDGPSRTILRSCGAAHGGIRRSTSTGTQSPAH